MRNGMRAYGVVLGLVLSAFAGTTVAGCVLISRTAPDSTGTWTETWRCDGQIVTRMCRGGPACVWDYRDEQ